MTVYYLAIRTSKEELQSRPRLPEQRRRLHLPPCRILKVTNKKVPRHPRECAVALNAANSERDGRSLAVTDTGEESKHFVYYEKRLSNAYSANIALLITILAVVSEERCEAER